MSTFSGGCGYAGSRYCDVVYSQHSGGHLHLQTIHQAKECWLQVFARLVARVCGVVCVWIGVCVWSDVCVE